MAKKDATRNRRPSRNAHSSPLPAPTSPPPATHTPNLLPLCDIVEDERARLMKAHSILSTVIAAMEAEGKVFREQLSSPEAKEAMTAFFEKRKPDFSRF